MAFCNSCGASLNEGTKFCNKCGAAVSGVPASAAPPIAPGPPPSKGGSSALKIILIVVGVFVLIGVLGMVTCGIVIHRAIKSAKHSQNGDVKVETPFGNMETSTDPEQTAKELGVEIYPGAELRKEGTASVTFGSLHTVTANYESSDSVDKICDFYRQKFPSAQGASSDQTHCSIVSGDKGNSTTISVQSRGDGSRFTIVSMTKKSQD
jgi:hypothetical protein